MNKPFNPTDHGFIWQEMHSLWVKYKNGDEAGYTIRYEQDIAVGRTYTITKVFLTGSNEQVPIYKGKIKNKEFALELFKNLGII